MNAPFTSILITFSAPIAAPLQQRTLLFGFNNFSGANLKGEVQWRSEYQICWYSQAQIPNIQIQNSFKIGMFWCLDLGWYGTIAIVPAFQKWNWYTDGGYLVRFRMVGLFSFGMSFGIQTIKHRSNFRPFKICMYLVWAPTVLVTGLPFTIWKHTWPVQYSDSHCTNNLILWNFK